MALGQNFSPVGTRGLGHLFPTGMKQLEFDGCFNPAPRPNRPRYCPGHPTCRLHLAPLGSTWQQQLHRGRDPSTSSLLRPPKSMPALRSLPSLAPAPTSFPAFKVTRVKRALVLLLVRISLAPRTKDSGPCQESLQEKTSKLGS